YFELNENLAMYTNTNPGVLTTTFDGFNTRNQFYGGQFGLRRGWNLDRFTIELAVKMALGESFQNIDRSGTTTTGFTTTGGIFNKASNIGRVTRDEFNIIPQAQAKLGFN